MIHDTHIAGYLELRRAAKSRRWLRIRMWGSLLLMLWSLLMQLHMDHVAETVRLEKQRVEEVRHWVNACDKPDIRRCA